MPSARAILPPADAIRAAPTTGAMPIKTCSTSFAPTPTPPRSPVGGDWEALVLHPPVRCVVQPAALRVRVPRDRPGVPDPTPVRDWNRLWQMALTGSGTGGGCPPGPRVELSDDPPVPRRLRGPAGVRIGSPPRTPDSPARSGRRSAWRS